MKKKIERYMIIVFLSIMEAIGWLGFILGVMRIDIHECRPSRMIGWTLGLAGIIFVFLILVSLRKPHFD